MQTDKPHLVSLGSGRLSTAITLLPLEEGKLRAGWQDKVPALQAVPVEALLPYAVRGACLASCLPPLTACPFRQMN